MEYPVYFQDDEHGEVCVTSPDLMGCFTFGEDDDHALIMAKEAVDCAVIGYLIDNERLPEPSNVDDLKDDPEYKDGRFYTVDVDICKLEQEAQRVVDHILEDW